MGTRTSDYVLSHAYVSSSSAGQACADAAVSSFFFFQAEDGIRDVAVTGVQTCALPIWTDVDPLPQNLSLADEGNETGHQHSGRLRIVPSLPPQGVASKVHAPARGFLDRKSVV